MEGCNGAGSKCGPSESEKASQLYRPTRERISDSSEENQDDQRHRQIVGLEEDKGIYGHPEVVVPPCFDSDEEEPIRGASPLRSSRTPNLDAVDPVDMAQSKALTTGTSGNEIIEPAIPLEKATNLEDLIPVSNLSHNPADFETSVSLTIDDSDDHHAESANQNDMNGMKFTYEFHH
ncbi:unnamed protein product [Anisakis simplex]|uniref:Uncharacterized protein n=1 Tax=Anisakis simplex TaxID=6269 RepID=A0A0M3J002_ANISI|nr:unnamed protein product [Anisakis simplex]